MISGTISSDDYLSAMRLHQKRTIRSLWIWLAVAAMSGIVMIALGHRLFAIGAGGVVGGLLGLLATSWLALPRKVRKLHAQQASLKDTFTYTWNSAALYGSSQSGNATRAWFDYIRVLENEHLFLLYHSDVMFEVLPKAWFRDRQQLAEFRSLIASAGLKPR